MTSRPEHDLSVPDGEVEAVGEAVQGTEPQGPGAEGADLPPDQSSGQAWPKDGEADEEAQPTTGDQLSQATEAILTDVAALTAERDEYLAALQRSQADFANYRKRVLRQQEELGARAVSELVRKLLPVLDTLDLALAHLAPAPREGGCDPAGAPSERPAAEVDALQQARSQLLDTLGKEGLERVDAVGVAFDPAVHEAVAHVESEGVPAGEEPGPKVAEVMRPGYRWRGQTLRAAMVRVRG